MKILFITLSLLSFQHSSYAQKGATTAQNALLEEASGNGGGIKTPPVGGIKPPVQTGLIDCSSVRFSSPKAYDACCKANPKSCLSGSAPTATPPSCCATIRCGFGASCDPKSCSCTGGVKPTPTATPSCFPAPKCAKGFIPDLKSCSCLPCPVPSCPNPPANCNYPNPTFDLNGCQTGCGNMVCSTPTPAPVSTTTPTPSNTSCGPNGNPWTSLANGHCRAAVIPAENPRGVFIVDYPITTASACLANANFQSAGICANIKRNLGCGGSLHPINPANQYHWEVKFDNASNTISSGVCSGN